MKTPINEVKPDHKLKPPAQEVKPDSKALPVLQPDSKTLSAMDKDFIKKLRKEEERKEREMGKYSWLLYFALSNGFLSAALWYFTSQLNEYNKEPLGIFQTVGYGYHGIFTNISIVFAFITALSFVIFISIVTVLLFKKYKITMKYAELKKIEEAGKK